MTLPKPKEKQLLINDEKILIAISNDTLILMETKSEIDKYLIEGTLTDAYLVEGYINDIIELIHNCYTARETGINYNCIIDDVSISFK